MRKLIIMYKSVRGNGKTSSKNMQFSLFVCKTQPTLDKVHTQGQPSAALVQHYGNRKTRKLPCCTGTRTSSAAGVAAASQHSGKFSLACTIKLQWGGMREEAARKNKTCIHLKLTMRPENVPH